MREAAVVAGDMREAEAGDTEAEAGGNRRALTQEITPFLTAYRINSARLCRLSFS
jgi:hypothetical protein